MSNLFLRHGEVQNKKDLFYANLPGFYLSSKGETQAKDAGIRIKENGINILKLSSKVKELEIQ